MREFSIDRNLLLSLTRERIDIDSLVDRLDERNAFEGIDSDDVFRAWKKSQVRRAAKQVKDESGYPLIFSIVTLGRDGKPVRKWKQERLFSVDDYRQVIEDYRQQKNRLSRIERWLVRRAKEKFGSQAVLFGEPVPA